MGIEGNCTIGIEADGPSGVIEVDLLTAGSGEGNGLVLVVEGEAVAVGGGECEVAIAIIQHQLMAIASRERNPRFGGALVLFHKL